MEQRPDLIIITAQHEEDLAADRAEIFVTAKGSSLVTGDAALRKAKEISTLVEDLEKCGVTEADIGLEGIHAEVSDGILGWSSSATYRLRIRCGSLEILPDVFGAITSAKNASLDGVVWRYPESAEQQAKWLRTCIKQANMKAEAAATALGARLVGVHKVTEFCLGEEETDFEPPVLGEVVARRRSASIQAGFALIHKKRTGLRVTIEYRVEGFKSAAGSSPRG